MALKGETAVTGIIRNVLVLFPILLLMSACTASDHARDVDQATSGGDRLTVGKVQREIRVGMSGAEVAKVLGSPNVVTTDEQRREVWVYDKISTNTVHSSSQGGVMALIFGAAPVGVAVGGAGGGSYNRSAGASATQQRTLTVIVKYDRGGRVRDFAYHTSRF
jgi:outer membrane protein assembly factor BamE (lipoprotein component of BamABCDE complex)